MKNNTCSKETAKILRKQVKKTDNAYCMKSLMNTCNNHTLSPVRTQQW